jgi:dephospho-CoA kinase
MVVFICGFTGNGKTTLAKYLSKKLNYFYYDSDKIKAKVFIKDPKFSYNIKNGIPFSSKSRSKMYKAIIKDFKHLSRTYKHIIVDDTLHTSLLRTKLLNSAKKYFGQYLTIQVTINEKVVRKRLQKIRKGHMLIKPMNMHLQHKEHNDPLKHIDFILNNSGGLAKSKKQLDNFIKTYLPKTI